MSDPGTWGLFLHHLIPWAIWSLIGSAVMATYLEGAQLLGVTRMSLTFLMGTVVTDDRRRAQIIGYCAYVVGGWLFGVLYALVLGSFPGLPLYAYIGAGLLAGFCHGLFLIAVFLPLLPVIHPRLTSDYDGPEALTHIEPPGAFGLNYGLATPVSTVAAQTLYGLILGIGYGAALIGGAG